MGRSRTHDEGELCENEGCTRYKAKAGYYTLGDGTKVPRWKPLCSQCTRAKFKAPWLTYRKDYCEGCGYRPFFIGSLDVHHRDGDKTNNEEENLETLCATCHRELEAILREVDGDVDKAESIFIKMINAIKP